MSGTTIATVVTLVIIVSVAAYYFFQMRKLAKAIRVVNNATEQQTDPLPFLQDTEFKPAVASYKKTIIISCGAENKSNTPSSMFFTAGYTSQAFNFNIGALDAASGTLIGLGLFGTFLGLTVGLFFFKNGGTAEIQQSIESLLGGMTTAFLTSLVGMALSIVYTMVYKHRRNVLTSKLSILANQLDELYYIDDMTLLNMRQRQMTVFWNDEGREVPIATAIREILDESKRKLWLRR